MRRFFPGKRASSKPPPRAPSHVGLQPSFVLPPVPHPHPYEHIALSTTDDGLIMRPHPSTASSHPPPCICIPWGKHPKVQELQRGGSDALINWKSSVVVYGIVGIVDLFNASYLLVVTARSHVGCLFDDDHSVYSVKSVRAIPLVKDRAKRVLETITSHISPSHAHNDSAQDPTPRMEESKSTVRVKFADENDVKVMSPMVDIVDDIQMEEYLPSLPSSGASTPTSSESLANTNVAKLIADRMSFWTRLSKRQPTLANDPATGPDEHQSLDSIIQSARGEPRAVIDTIVASTAPPPESAEERHTELEGRVIRECIREYAKGCMYFAYHFDITRSLQNKHDQFLKSCTEENLLAKLDVLPSATSAECLDSNIDPLAEPSSTLPLWKRVNREFWWNEWLLKPFIDAGMHSYVLPIVQGHFQASSFDLPMQSYMSEHDLVSPSVNYVIASRRSKYRAGLRYQRRGVDEEAHVANFVETETIMRIKRNDIAHVFSFVQIRGSVPLFWTQSGYSMKPPPVLLPECTTEQNLDAIKRHFRRTVAIYGPHTIVNLAEQTGKESILTNAYKSYAERTENKAIHYCGYDFHHETRGMKYEKISKLIDELGRTFESQGYFWVSDCTLLSQQKGVFRVNCIDCLDRTNVVQSAFARHVLGRQLEAVGLTIEPQTGRSGVDIVFNDVWANNGDTISRAYAGTSALKGDYTRTGKRDLGGLLNDGVNSLARMYSATFSDWFCQAVIDFMLGYRTTSVFSEFLLKLQSTDPRELLRLSRIRAEAIATSVARTLNEGESLLAGWTLIAPHQLNVKISDKFEEKILLLSARALYIISYDYALEKVKVYTRVPLGLITNITKGAYILSPLEEASRDPIQNAGFSVAWLNTDLVDSRMTSYSYRNNIVNIFPGADGDHSYHVEEDRTSISSGTRYIGNRLWRMMQAPSQPVTQGTDTSFAAFKALPVGSTHVRNGSGYTEAADELAGATSCKEAIDLIVDTIKRACEDIGSGSKDDFVSEGDIVSVSEAQRTTSIYAKMEYGVKRLLWLGG